MEIQNQYKKGIKFPINYEEWYSILEKKINLFDTFEIHGPILQDSESDLPWYWRQENDVITIYFRDLNPDDILVENNSIHSPSLNGVLWSGAEVLRKEKRNNFVELDLLTSVHFPVLVKGCPNTDGLSAFYLALLSIKLQRTDYFLLWGYRSIEKGEHNAMHFIGRFLISEQKYDEAIYVLSLAVTLHHDQECELYIGSLIWKNIVEYPNPILAENILCKFANLGNSEALISLNEFIASFRSDSEQNIRILYDLSQGLDNSDVTDILNESKESLSKPKWVDYTISFAIFAITVFGGTKIYKYFSKKR